MIRLTIDNGSGPIDYTNYVLPDSITIDDSINVPTLLNFTLANNDNRFVVPVRSGYCRLFSGKFNIPIATGFVTSVPSRKYLGGAPNVPAFNFQRYLYDVQVTSDEWLLNVKTVPYLPPFVNKGQGQILAQLAEILVPGFFDTTSHVASGDLVPDFPYDPTVNWADLAKQFADGARYRYKVIDRVIYFQPFGDAPLGVSYDETKGQATFYPDLLETPVVPLPPVNDAIVIGDVEAQNNHEDYFVGDGITGNFPLRHEVFEGASSILIDEPWTGSGINSSLWSVFDPTFAISEEGGGLQLQGGDGLGSTYVLANSGVEVGGAVNVQAGDFQFVDVCDGIVGGLYSDAALTQDVCLAGFILGSSGTVVPTASGAIGVTMQPLLLGLPLGPTVVSQQNHSYQLQIYFSAQTWSRYDRPYRTLVGEVFGDTKYSGQGTVTWIISDTSIDFPNNPNITLFSQQNVHLPEFALFAPVNANNLNLAMTNTLVGLPPQAGLWVRSLYGPTANQFPVIPPGPELQYLLGFGFQNQVATIGNAGDVQELQFYASPYQTLIGATLPAVGSRIKLQSWESGAAMCRVQDPVAIAAEAKIVGDDGHRTAVMRTLKPLPRTSSECEAAGAAAIKDRNTVQYQGTYTFNDWFLDATNVNRVFGTLPDYPRPGRYLIATAPIRGISGTILLVRRVTLKVIELREEVLTLTVDFGPDYYLDKLLNKFVEFRDDILTPKDIAKPPTPQQLLTIGEFYLPTLDNATIVCFINGYDFKVDLGVVPATGVEVRKADAGWGLVNKNLLRVVTTQRFTMPRKANEEIYFLREVNGGKYSRFSKVLRLVYPLIPHPPSAVLIDFTVPQAPVLFIKLPINTDRNIYGVQIDNGGIVIDPEQQLQFTSDATNDFRTMIITGFSPDETPISEVLVLNGTNPVTTLLFYGFLESVRVIGGCGTDFTPAIEEITLLLEDDSGGNWQDQLSSPYLYLMLFDDINNWDDDVQTPYKFVQLEDDLNNWNDAFVFSGVPLALFLSLSDSMNNWNDRITISGVVLPILKSLSDNINNWGDNISIAGTTPALVITTTTIPDATVGIPYSFALTATGGTPPYTWSIASGTMPAGLSLSSSGVISGTPLVSVSMDSITFKVADSG